MKNWGMSLARADAEMRRNEDEHWWLVSKHSRTIPLTARVDTDPAMRKLAEPYQQETEKYLDIPSRDHLRTFSGKYARYENNPLLDRQACGVTYEVDLTNPVGQRILDLGSHGKRLAPTQTLRVAPTITVTQAAEDTRLIRASRLYSDLPAKSGSSYLTRTKTIPAEAAVNWKMEPAEAVTAIERASEVNVGAQSK